LFLLRRGLTGQASVAREKRSPASGVSGYPPSAKSSGEAGAPE
jgi:hypothetical protein